jgi:hypothetical protein
VCCLIVKAKRVEAFSCAGKVEFIEKPHHRRYYPVMSFRRALRILLLAAVTLAGCVCLCLIHLDREFSPTRIGSSSQARQDADLAKARICFFEVEDNDNRLWIKHHDSATGLPTVEMGTVDLGGRGRHSLFLVNHDQAANQLILTLSTPGALMPVYARLNSVEGGFLARWSPLAGSRYVRRERQMLQTLLPGYVGADGQFRFHKSAPVPASRLYDNVPVQTRKTGTRTYRQAVEYAKSLEAGIQPIPHHVKQGILQKWFERLGKIIPALKPKPRPLPGWSYSYGSQYYGDMGGGWYLSIGTACLGNRKDASLILEYHEGGTRFYSTTFTVVSPGKKQAVSVSLEEDGRESWGYPEVCWRVRPPDVHWGNQTPPRDGDVDPVWIHIDREYSLELEFLNAIKYAYGDIFEEDVLAEPNNPDFARYYCRHLVPGEKLVILRYPAKSGKWPPPARYPEGSAAGFETEHYIFIRWGDDVAAYDKKTDEYFFVFVSPGSYHETQDVALVDDWLLIGQWGLCGLWAINTRDFSVRQFPADDYACKIDATPTAILLNKKEVLPRPLSYGGFVRRASQVGEPYPQSCRYGSIRSVQGGTICVDELKGRVVLLDLWSLQDPKYRAEIPDLVRLYSDYHAQGLEMIGICCTAPCRSEQAARLIEGLGILWPQYADEPILWPTDADRSPNPQNCPQVATTRLLLDRQCIVRYKDLSGPPLTDAIETLLRESPATPTRQ